VHEEVASDEDENKLPYQSPKWIPPKSHVNTTTNPTKGNYVYKTVTKYTSFFNFPIVFMLSSLWATICILQNDVVLVKKQKKTKINGLQPGLDQVLSGQLGRRVTLNFFFSIFSLIQPGLIPESAGSQIYPPDFKTMILSVG